MLVDWPNSIIIGGCSDQIQSVQMATLRIRDHPSLRALVFTLRPQLRILMIVNADSDAA